MRQLNTPRIWSFDAAERVRDAETFEQLKALRAEWFRAAVRFVAEAPAEAHAAVDEVQRAHELFLTQAIRVSLQTLQALGMGPPPVPYAFLLFGSGGRREQTLISDQDSGLVYECPAAASKQERLEIANYFRVLTGTVVQGLAEIGYPPCEGNVLCSHPSWRGSPDEWEARWIRWCEDPTWAHVRYLLVTADARFLAGDAALAGRLTGRFRELVSAQPELIPRMASNTFRHRVPLGWFGRLLVEVRGRYRGGINVKEGLYLPFVNGVRLWALAAGAPGTGTLERIAALHQLGVWSRERARATEETVRRVLGLRLMAAHHWEDGQYESLRYVKVERLPREIAARLKPLMRDALDLQRETARRFGPPP